MTLAVEPGRRRWLARGLAGAATLGGAWVAAAFAQTVAPSVVTPPAVAPSAVASAEAAGAASATAPWPSAIAWQPRFVGVETARLEVSLPRPLVAQLARVDLRAPGLRWLATPAADPSAGPGPTRGRTTSNFLREHRLQLAINAAPFDPVRPEEGGLHQVVGLQVSQGRLVSGPARQFPALLLGPDGRARIEPPPFDLTGVDNAVAGFEIVLRAGLPTAAASPVRLPSAPAARTALHPRTAVGLDAAGRRAWLVVVDGRQSGHSEGVTLAELASLLRALGASEGLNLDGGGTSTLVIEDASGEPRVLNRPIHGGVPGQERASGSHLGLWALPLPADDPAARRANPSSDNRPLP